MKYRQPIRKLVTKIVSTPMDKKAASGFIKNNTTDITQKDRRKFIEYVETELLSLHEGNFARYIITPAEFKRWKEIWD
jgi:hypothetical protein